jgi:hypothetical protein
MLLSLEGVVETAVLHDNGDEPCKPAEMRQGGGSSSSSSSVKAIAGGGGVSLTEEAEPEVLLSALLLPELPVEVWLMCILPLATSRRWWAKAADLATVEAAVEDVTAGVSEDDDEVM